MVIYEIEQSAATAEISHSFALLSFLLYMETCIDTNCVKQQLLSFLFEEALC